MTDTQRIRVDLRNRRTYDRMYTIQTDRNTVLEFEITLEGEPYDITGATALLQAGAPSGNGIGIPCVVNNNIATALLSPSITQESGKYRCQIVLTQGENVQVTSTTFVLWVDRKEAGR